MLAAKLVDSQKPTDESDSLQTQNPELQQVYDKFKIDSTNLTTVQKEKLATLLHSFKDLWSKEKREGPLERITSTSHTIEVDGPPIKHNSRRTSSVEDHIIWQHINKMALHKVIRPSKSPWASPILLADKKNGKIRFCIDFRALNKVTKKDSYLLPKMDEILAVLGNASYFSTIDLTDAFWSIPIHLDDIEKTAFTSKYGLWEFLSIPFGLCNTPPTQQRFIEVVLNGLLWICCFAYLDDILTFSTSFEDHIKHLEQILTRLRDHNLILQPSKCSFCRPTFEILGFVASKDGLSPNPKKVKAIKDYPLPRTPKEVSRFLGMTSWLRRFIPRLSALTHKSSKSSPTG